MMQLYEVLSEAERNILGMMVTTKLLDNQARTP